MSRLPWFKFYPGDYLLDPRVDDLPREAEGLLLRRWCLCHREGSCPADAETLARKILCTIEYVSRYLDACLVFFEQRAGKLFSRRMEEEKRRSEIARKNANERYKSTSKTNTETESEGESERSSANGNASGSAISSAKAIRSRACQFPENFAPRESHRALAAELGIDLERAFANFTDHHLARGSTFKDWNHALNQWIRREQTFSHGSNNGATPFTSISERNKAAAAQFERQRAQGGL